MRRLSISLLKSLTPFVEMQATQHGYRTGSDDVRDLVREDQERVQFRNLLLAGAGSKPGKAATQRYFEQLRARVRKGQLGKA